MVSWLSWGSRVFSALMSDLCVLAWAMEALCRPADQTHKLTQITPPDGCLVMQYCALHVLCTMHVFSVGLASVRDLVMGIFLLFIFW